MSLFVDTGAWVALTWPHDPEHGRATRFLERDPDGPVLVTTDAVLTETITVLRIRAGHRTAVAFLNYLARKPSRMVVVWTDAELHAAASAIFRKTGDPVYSFVDCLSFAVMQRDRIREVFAFDSDFRTFGFTVQPGPKER